jgi:hypothetical protein
MGIPRHGWSRFSDDDPAGWIWVEECGMNEAKEALTQLAKLGNAVKLVAEDCGLELRMFGVTPT